MCAPQIRLAFRRFFETTFADLTVLSYAEVPSRVEIQNAGIIPCPGITARAHATHSFHRRHPPRKPSRKSARKLGPEAVVLNVRPLPANGLARLWQKPMIEVLAHRARSARAPKPLPIAEALAEFRQQLQEIKQQVETQALRGEREAPDVEPAGFCHALVNRDRRVERRQLAGRRGPAKNRPAPAARPIHSRPIARATWRNSAAVAGRRNRPGPRGAGGLVAPASSVVGSFRCTF